jgi:hypothetical protein
MPVALHDAGDAHLPSSSASSVASPRSRASARHVHAAHGGEYARVLNVAGQIVLGLGCVWLGFYLGL